MNLENLKFVSTEWVIYWFSKSCKYLAPYTCEIDDSHAWSDSRGYV
jgi:hypothetical protein